VKNELEIVRDISQKLQELQIPFMLTGSMALSYYAQPRFTRDIDLVVSLVPGDVARLVQSFEKEYYVSQEAAVEAARGRTQFNLIHFESVIKVDCIVRKDTEHARTEFDRRRAITIGGIATFVVSKEDLILAKLSWAKASRSEVQMGDVKNLLATGWDREYLEPWAAKLGLGDLLQECLHG